MGSFPKRQRKLSVTAQSDLFKSGTVLFHHPYKVFYTIRKDIPASDKGDHNCTIVISVPKRNFKRAVDRNRIKRQMREAFRQHNDLLNKDLTAHSMQIDLLCLYLPNEHAATSILSEKMETLLARLRRLVTQTGPAADDRIG